MFLKVYKHVFTRVRLCSSKKIHINITHIALMLIWILLDYRVNSAKNHVFRLPFQKGSTKYFHFHVFVFLQVLCIWIYPNLALFTPKIQIDTQTRGGARLDSGGKGIDITYPYLCEPIKCHFSKHDHIWYNIYNFYHTKFSYHTKLLTTFSQS